MPDEAGCWQYVEDIARQIFHRYGYAQIRTPIFEETGLFSRSIGDTTDIVQKQMYTFQDRAGRSMTLRPEATAPVIRAFLEHGLDRNAGVCKLYYIGPMFRSERPQKGRRRQFHQLGVEAIGSSSPYLDVEIIALLMRLLGEVLEGVSAECRVRLNSVGCPDDRQAYSRVLRQELKDRVKLMCSDCQYRYEHNIFRLLDCKNENCRKIITGLPVFGDYLCQDCGQHFQQVKEGLGLIGIDFDLDPFLVRGLDYYTRTAFEVTHSLLGGQDAVAAGGRYDNLITQLGGPQLGAVGFALGLERLLLICQTAGVDLNQDERLDVFIITMDDKTYRQGFRLLERLRSSGISADIDYESKSLRAQMKMAGRSGCRFAVILGQEELEKDVVTFKDMDSGQQEQIPQAEVVGEIRRRIEKND